jgi:hypothetical protein
MTDELPQTRGAAQAPLSNEQKQKLAALAHYAYDVVDPDQSFDDWRHHQVQRVVQKPGLRACANGDYLTLKAHFLDLAGRTTAAFKAAFKAVNEPRDWALFTLMKECTAAKDVMPEAMKYARGFIKNKRGVALEDADAKTLWHAVYTVRRKAQQERRKRRGGESAKDVLTDLLRRAPQPQSEDPF